MEDSFKVKVDKVFGSLASSSSSSTTPSSSLSSLWCLTDDELHRNQWKLDKQDEEEPAVDIRFQMEKDLNDLDDDDEEEKSGDDSRVSSRPKPDDYNDEEWDIKNSIGLDSTLDNEEEEDEYDEVAVGRDKAPGDQFYLQDVDDYGIDIDSSNELPSSFKELIRDPRANHIAAKIRLKEDAEAARKMDSLQVTEKDTTSDHDGSLKSILKKREDDALVDSKSSDHGLESKSQKRVRFDPEFKDDEMKDAQMETDSSEEKHQGSVYQLPPDYPSGIPDYMRNPSKYTRYTFDSSSDVDEQSNKQAYMDFLRMLKASKSTEDQEDVIVELPKSVTFVPKKRGGDVPMVDNSINDARKAPLLRRDAPIAIAAGDVEENESCPMEESEPETVTSKRTNSQRQGRQYRNRAKVETDDYNCDC